ncbi:glycosyltransferase family 4 protein [Candidatus Woesearchaeota archaeon]|nr:glycosyltransferase family 4 protein [Candidatus Woesearchaeota archaeon]
MKPLKILIITSKFPRFADDPQPPFVFHFAKELVRQGHHVVAVAPHDGDAELEEVLDGVRIFRFRYFFPVSWQRLSYGPGIPTNISRSLFALLQAPFFVVSQILASRRVANDFKPDVVHAHWAFPQGLAARFTGFPYVVNFYGGELVMARRFRLVWLLNYIVDRSFRSFTVTNYYVRFIREMGVRRPLGAVPLGVDISSFRPDVSGAGEVRRKFCRDGELMVLFVGRLVERKGPDYLVDAFQRVVGVVSNARLVVVGGGPMLDSLRAQASSLGISDRVVFAGEIPNAELPKYYCACDLFVLPSIVDRHGDREGQGVVYAEAMACRKPVIGTNTGGIPDVISPKVGLLVREKDSEDLAAGIVKLLKDSGLRDRMGQNAYKLVHERFAWDKIAREYVKVFRACAK